MNVGCSTIIDLHFPKRDFFGNIRIESQANDKLKLKVLMYFINTTKSESADYYY